MTLYRSSETIDWFDVFSEELNLNRKIRDESEDFYNNKLPERIKHEDLILAATSVYIVSRQNNEYRSKKQFAHCISNKIFQRRRDQVLKKIKRAYKKVRKKKDIDINSPNIESQIKYLADELELDDNEVNEALELGVEAMESEILTGRSPVSVSAGTLMVVNGVSACSMKEYTGTGEGTLKRMEEFIEEEVTDKVYKN